MRTIFTAALLASVALSTAAFAQDNININQDQNAPKVEEVKKDDAVKAAPHDKSMKKAHDHKEGMKHDSKGKKAHKAAKSMKKEPAAAPAEAAH